MYKACITVKRLRLDGDNGADDVGALFDDCSIQADGVDKLHCAAIDAAEVSKRRNVKLQQDPNDEFYGEPVELTGGKTETGGDGRAIMSAIVERNVAFKWLMVQAAVKVTRLPVYMLRGIECFHCRAALRPNGGESF